MEASIAAYAKSSLSGSGSSDDNSRPNLSNFHPSYSTNDVPTLKNNRMSATELTPPKSQAQQFHNHNASLGRIPPNAINRHSRELSNEGRRDEARDYQQISSILQASAPAFNLPTTAASPSETNSAQTNPFNNSVATFPNQNYYGNYGMPLVHMSPMQMNNPLFQQQMQLYQQPHNGFLPFNTANATFGSVSRFQDTQSRVMQQRRAQSGEDHARFNNVQLESQQGEILSLCKDQHGCRYLQKKLEERNAQNVQMIFLETHQHVVELMTDPFGNYLCQKLLEYSNDEQRTQLIHNATPEMLKIALNSHGTRALQKMIEFISTPEQTQMIISALKDRVVELIQDLNGNHVIQKCLNRLSSQDAQVRLSPPFSEWQLTGLSLFLMQWVRIALLLAPIAMVVVYFSAASITLQASSVPTWSTKSRTMPSILSKILSATTSFNILSIFRKLASLIPCVTLSKAKSHNFRSRSSAAM